IKQNKTAESAEPSISGRCSALSAVFILSVIRPLKKTPVGTAGGNSCGMESEFHIPLGPVSGHQVHITGFRAGNDPGSVFQDRLHGLTFREAAFLCRILYVIPVGFRP